MHCSMNTYFYHPAIFIFMHSQCTFMHIVKRRVFEPLRPYYTMLCFIHILDFFSLFNRDLDTNMLVPKTREKHEKITKLEKNARFFFFITLCVGSVRNSDFFPLARGTMGLDNLM